MSFRLTFALIAILLGIAGYAYILSTQSDDEPEGPVLGGRAWFYEGEPDDVNSIGITFFGETETFVRVRPGDWRFDSVEGPPVGPRFAGTYLLASGGQTPRVIVRDPSPAELTEYGFDTINFAMGVGLATGETVHVELGGMTPDGSYNYARKGGSDTIYLMDQIWGEVLAEMVTDPPFPSTPTPVP